MRVRPLSRFVSRAACAVALAVVSTHAARAQSSAPPSFELAHPLDTGWLPSNPGSVAVVATHTVQVSGAPWMRLRFGSLILPPGVRIRMTSFADGATQELDADAAREWRFTGAYFNGDAVQLDVVSEPGAGQARVVLRSVWIGPLSSPQFSVCGPIDDRVLSSDPRVARLMPVGCTGWLFDDAAHCLSTAGHCAGSLLQVAEFNVPLSDASGAVQHPSPDHQYAVDPASVQRQNAGLGQDWGYFGCFPNANTGLSPYQRQQAAFVLAAPPAVSNQSLRVTGYGVDFDTATSSYAQQTHAGAYVALQGATLQHDADTTGGNSGSPIVLDDGTSRVIGVHTHGGCSSSSTTPGANHGTSTSLSTWALARANPTGACSPSPTVTNYCTPKINSLGCVPSISAVGTPSATNSAGGFTLHASSLINRRLAYFLYGVAPKSAPFQGGVLCVAPPRRRASLQSSGGTLLGVDCTGTLDFDMGAKIASGTDASLTYGAVLYAQCWSRDPFDPSGASLTDGLRFTIGP